MQTADDHLMGQDITYILHVWSQLHFSKEFKKKCSLNHGVQAQKWNYVMRPAAHIL